MTAMEKKIPAGISRIALFAALVGILALEFVFALVLGAAVLHYLDAVMDLAQLTPDVVPV